MVSDPRGVTLLMKQQPVLWLVRHGETTWNSMGWVQGQIDGARLTRRGRYQARHAADLLASEPVGAVYSSDLYRARRTAYVIGKRFGFETKTDCRLRERCFGLAEGVPSTRVPSSLTGIEEGRVRDQYARPPGGESLDDVYRRCRSFLDDLQRSTATGDTVVVAHGGSIRMLRAVLAEQALNGLAWDAVPNASICRVELPRLSA
jgi:broad specificity phosphatase PhoE